MNIEEVKARRELREFLANYYVGSKKIEVVDSFYSSYDQEKWANSKIANYILKHPDHFEKWLSFVENLDEVLESFKLPITTSTIKLYQEFVELVLFKYDASLEEGLKLYEVYRDWMPDFFVDDFYEYLKNGDIYIYRRKDATRSVVYECIEENKEWFASRISQRTQTLAEYAEDLINKNACYVYDENTCFLYNVASIHEYAATLF